MNSLRDVVDQSYLANSNILSPDGTLYLDHLPKGHQVQFILRRKPIVHSHIRAGELTHIEQFFGGMVVQWMAQSSQ